MEKRGNTAFTITGRKRRIARQKYLEKQMAEKPTYGDLEKRVQELQQTITRLKSSQDHFQEKSLFLEASLHQCEEICTTVLTLTSDSVSISRVSDGRYVLVNDAFSRLTGYSAEEAVGRTPLELNLYADLADRDRIVECLRKNGRVDSLEVRFRVKGGSIRDDLLSAMPIRYQGEECFLSVCKGITSLNHVQEELKESEESYRSILALAPDAIAILRAKDGRYIQINEAFCRMTGYGTEEIIGKTSLDLNLYPDPFDRRKITEILQRDGRVDALEIRFQAKNGNIMDDLVSARPIRFKGEDCVLVVATTITSLKEAQNALRESEEKYRNILETMDEGYWETDLKGKLTFFNKAFLRLSGLPSRDLLLGLDSREYTSPQEFERIYRIFSEVYRTGIPTEVFDFEVTVADGSRITVEMSVSLLRNASGDAIGFRGISRDRTEQRKAERALKESEQRYRSILETMEEAYWETDLAGNFTFFNDALCRLHGYPRDEVRGMNYRRFSSPQDSGRIYSIYNQIYRTGVPTKLIDFDVIKKDGSVVMTESSASLIRNSSGEPVGFRGISRDRTEQRTAERALRESEEKHRLVVENANEGIFIIQDEGVKFPNSRTKELTGYTTEDLASMSFLDLVHSKDRAVFRKAYQEQPEAGVRCLRTQSFRLVNKKGEILWVELNHLPISWEERPATLNFLKDLTPQKKMEAQLFQAKKLEAIGTLAGGIAHDFNNLLMGIQGNTSLILLDMDSENPHYGNLRNIEKLVKNGSELTRQLLGAARRGKYEVKPTNLSELIRTSADLFSRTKKEISIHQRFQENLWTVEVDQGQIEQVLLNLYVNAWHAMPEGGDLFIETQNLTLGEYEVRAYGVTPGRFVRISVTDSGIGMDEAVLKRVFDPFFTTRHMGRGTGLGLASAYGIIRNHNGVINVYSEKGAGSTFNVYLPATDKEIRETPEPTRSILNGNETILFVDDEDAIVELGHQFLSRLGFHVKTAKSGKEALEVYRKEKEGIDLVILDMIMPRMSGGEAYDRLKQIDPSINVLLSSGYSLNGQAQEILDRGCRGFIQKPYTLEKLSRKVREALDH
jgi:two-component system cell cycle sensor histidine kinase/response regulator CckA